MQQNSGSPSCEEVVGRAHKRTHKLTLNIHTHSNIHSQARIHTPTIHNHIKMHTSIHSTLESIHIHPYMHTCTQTFFLKYLPSKVRSCGWREGKQNASEGADCSGDGRENRMIQSLLLIDWPCHGSANEKSTFPTSSQCGLESVRADDPTPFCDEGSW